MIDQANGEGHVGDAGSLVVVRVEDAIDPRLSGLAGAAYRSPAQASEQAMTLVGLLVGGDGHRSNGESRWVTAIAGGRRTVTLERV